jgi:hypothetical protein
MDKMEEVHIRKLNGDDYGLCGKKGGTISLRHFQEQKPHVESLEMCKECVKYATESGQ